MTVLSPHRDDAAFSLAVALSRWSQANVPITVVNFFTISSYAPYFGSATTVAEISSVREAEDRDALASIDASIQVESFDLLDAPLRLNISPAAISAVENSQLQPHGETEALASLIEPYLARGLAIAPLALGDHIDHHAVRRAAMSLTHRERLGFYEDLPYATWTTEEQLTARVEEIEAATGLALEPAIVSGPDAIRKKLGVVSRYTSQITHIDAEAIASHASRYAGGERIWIPKRDSWGVDFQTIGLIQAARARASPRMAIAGRSRS